ncbi:hypothetical protein EUGRSUZ_F03053 [Eucalyptus grandis]|uniref:Uncharacterized protein n=2 Tax=Eucalyptus grandis TaxID=71139 RepID=A0ACC3KK10_EUCGR|nr:hypothetical protein EUGRSUZ_F03053 [Eucalyptus grandis]
MEFQEKTKRWSFIDEEASKVEKPTLLCVVNHRRSSERDDMQFSAVRIPAASAASSPVRPMSPETPWMLSPVRTSPSQPLLYHCLVSLHRHEGSILSLAVSKDFIFTGTKSCRIRAWARPDCTEAGHIKANSGEVRAILARGRILITAHGDHRVRVWDVSAMDNFRPKKIATLPPKNSFFMFPRKSSYQKHKDYISCLAYNHEEKLLYTGSWDKTVKAWKILENRCVDSFVAHESHVHAIAINQEDGCVFTCSSDASVKIWRRVFGESSHILTMTLKFQLSPVNALALSSSPSTCILYSGSSDGLINFWEKEKTSGRFNHGGFLQGHHFAVLCLAAVADLIFSGSEDATIRVWRREEGNCLHTCLAVMDGHHGPVKCLAATLEREATGRGLLVYSASLDQTFKVWRVKVNPAETVSLQHSATEDQQMDSVDFETSPVLSPSWVAKKLQFSRVQ